MAALQRWLEFARIIRGPRFRRVQRGKVGAAKRPPCRAARQTPGGGRRPARRSLGGRTRGAVLRPFAARRARLLGWIEECYVQKQLGQASAEMTRRYQRPRDGFRVNLTKAA